MDSDIVADGEYVKIVDWDDSDNVDPDIFAFGQADPDIVASGNDVPEVVGETVDCHSHVWRRILFYVHFFLVGLLSRLFEPRSRHDFFLFSLFRHR